MSLKLVVDEFNMFAKLFRELPMDYNNLTQTEAYKLYRSIDGDMSPEVLHMDGEVTAAQAQQRKRLLDKAVRELDDRGFSRPTDTFNLDYL